MKFFILAMLLFSQIVNAQDTAATESKFKGESEASSILVNGNSDSETYGAKTKGAYNFTESDIGAFFGRMLRTSSGGNETGKLWEAGARYERVITKDAFSIFIQHKAEHDPYNGIFVQRDSTDLGGKYIVIKNDHTEWLAEAGFRYAKIYDGTSEAYSHFGRVYTEAGHKLTATTKAKLWLEYLPNFKNSDQYQYNAELSLSVMMNEIFSLKTAYLLNHNEAIAAPLKKDTTTWTTALVASY